MREGLRPLRGVSTPIRFLLVMLQIDDASPIDRIVDPVRQGMPFGTHMHGPAKANARPFNLKVHRARSLLAERVCRHPS